MIDCLLTVDGCHIAKLQPITGSLQAVANCTLQWLHPQDHRKYPPTIAKAVARSPCGPPPRLLHHPQPELPSRRRPDFSASQTTIHPTNLISPLRPLSSPSGSLPCFQLGQRGVLVVLSSSDKGRMNSPTGRANLIRARDGAGTMDKLVRSSAQHHRHLITTTPKPCCYTYVPL